MSAAWTIAANEIRLGMRNYWILASAVLMIVLSLALSTLGSAPVGEVGASALSVTSVSLASLAIFMVPLMALLLSSDSIVGDVESGNMLLFLACPISRSSVIVGKFLGQTAIIAIAVIAGYASAAALSFGSTEVTEVSVALTDFAGLTLSSICLGAVFVAIGLLVSNFAKQRGAAAGMAVALWLTLVLLFDMILLGLLVTFGGDWLPSGGLGALLLFNPADVFRLLNISGLGGSGLVSGTVNLSGELTPATLWAALAVWLIIPLAIATVGFQRKEI